MERFPNEAQDGAGDMVGEYVLNIMREYAPYKYIPFKSAYGGFFSDKQRKYVMASIREGKSKPDGPNRSQGLREGWVKICDGAYKLIVNPGPYAVYVVGDIEHSRMHI